MSNTLVNKSYQINLGTTLNNGKTLQSVQAKAQTVYSHHLAKLRQYLAEEISSAHIRSPLQHVWFRDKFGGAEAVQ